LKEKSIECSEEKASKICSALKERVTFPKDFWEQGKFFFIAPTQFDDQVISKKWNEETVKFLSAYSEELKSLSSITAELAKSSLEKASQATGIASGKIMQALRVTLSGGASGPDLMITMEIIGKEETLSRISYALENIKVKVS
jgi:glutamyl-tRNA synthetase